ncbi:TA system toxin CbtA family protein [Providencia hangzhouensis]|uniref:Toxin YkfI n=1 Tax=Providencia rettgeri TaxID=587 RepID=A0A9N8GZ76_PRORE|nr:MULTISPECIES: TA system toxin CbtA family protein [Providencia]MCB4855676.1 toxin [Providencia rettgeri]MCW4539331.1 toxin [Providencia rettgeri]MDX4117389.1 TA system toxin CbtA family protein [Providencia rettgeri]CAB5650150.1 Toxin YkfI [Providencia rettgeri]CAB5689391.1 Toxin YkfI [Providencia rettgeri]
MDRHAIVRFQILVHQLLAAHFGLSLNDTSLCENAVVSRLIEDGISPVLAVNGLVDKYRLNKLNASECLPSSPYVSESDALLAQMQYTDEIKQVTDIDGGWR